MEKKEEAKANILRGVNKKMRIKGMIIAVTSISICLLIGIIGYFIFRTPMKTVDIMNADLFKDACIETRMQIITEVDSQEVLYNHLHIPLTDAMISAMNDKSHYYVENNDDNTATLYFYISECYQKEDDNSRRFEYDTDILLHPLNPSIRKTGNQIPEITKVYYLVYDYDNFNEQEFEKMKSEAIMLWEK